MASLLNTQCIFRLVSLLEGLSYLFMMFYVMPLKYLYGNLALMKFVGMAHGVLFIAFVLALYFYKRVYKINNELCFDFFIYSLTPFGFLLVEKRIKE